MSDLKLIDTHAHIYSDEYKDDNQLVINMATEAGVRKIFMPNIDLESIDPMLEMERKYPDICHAMMGLHPCYIKEGSPDTLKIIEDWLSNRKFCAIGEAGLDYHWDKSNMDEQKKAFEQQIIWAKELRLPLVIHSRKSMDDCIALIRKHQNGNLRGVFHCFSGSLEEAKKIEDLGFYMGIGGVITYKNAGLKEVVKHIPNELLLLETDAPYLPPVPYRGKRNEPAYLTYIVEALADAKELSKEEIAQQTTENALKLFGQTI